MPVCSRTRSASVLVLTAALGMVGCYHYRVASPAVANLNEPVSVTQWSILWGIIQSKDEDTTCRCMNNGMSEVTASTNFGYLILGVVSLGIVVPTELTYVCGKPPVGGKWPDPPAQGRCPSLRVFPAPPGGPPMPADSAQPSTPPDPGF